MLETIRESTGVALDLRRNTSSPISNSLTAVEQKVADYINGAIDRIQQIASKAPKLYVFSDNIPWADRILGLRGDIHYVDTCTQVSQIDTLRLMSACQYHLISNSKLAWWAAWLNTSKERQVVIPSVVLAKSIWRDYLPVMENWYAMDESYCQSQISNAA